MAFWAEGLDGVGAVVKADGGGSIKEVPRMRGDSVKKVKRGVNFGGPKYTKSLFVHTFLRE